MSLLAGYGLSGGSPPGIREEVADQEQRMRQALRTGPLQPGSGSPDGYRELYTRELVHSGAVRSQAELVNRAALRTVPDVPVLFGGFHAMVYIGMSLLLVYTLALLLRKRILADGHRGLLVLLPGILPLPWLASTAGWIVAEMGRQPWVVYGYLPTMSGAQLPSLAHGVFGTLLVTALYISLAFLFALLSLRLIRRGPGAPLLTAPWWRRLAPLRETSVPVLLTKPSSNAS